MMDFKKTIPTTTLILLLITQASALNTSLEVQNLTSTLLVNATPLGETPTTTDLAFHKSSTQGGLLGDLSFNDYINGVYVLDYEQDSDMWTSSRCTFYNDHIRCNAVWDWPTNKIAVLKKNVRGPAKLEFEWTGGGSGDYSHISFYIDGVQKIKKKTGFDWETEAYEIPEGIHEIKWYAYCGGSHRDRYFKVKPKINPTFITWDSSGDKTVYLKLPKNAETINTVMDLNGPSAMKLGDVFTKNLGYSCRGEGGHSDYDCEGCAGSDFYHFEVSGSESNLARYTITTTGCGGSGSNNGEAIQRVVCHTPSGDDVYERIYGYDSYYERYRELKNTVCAKTLNLACDSIDVEAGCKGYADRYYGSCSVGSCNSRANFDISYELLFPTNFSVDVGGWGIYSRSGDFTGPIILSNFSEQINDYLENCSPDAEGYCMVPLVFHSDSPGQVKISGINVGYKILKVGDEETVSFSKTATNCRHGVSTGPIEVKATASETKTINPPGIHDYVITTSFTAHCEKSLSSTKSCSTLGTGVGAGWWPPTGANITCYKPDGSTEKVDGWNTEVELNNCVKIKINAKASVRSRAYPYKNRRVDVTLSGNARVSYSKPKDYLRIGCLSNESCDDGNNITEDKCESNKCMHRYSGSGWFESNTLLVAGVENNVSATIRNSGTATGSFITSLLVDGIPQKYQILNLSAGESRNIIFDYTPQVGTHNISIAANLLSDGVTVQELFTGNNIITRQITVEGSVEESEPTDSAASFEDVLLSIAGQRTLAVGCSVDRQCWDGFHETTDECVDGVCTHSCEGGCFPGFDYSGEYILDPTNLKVSDTVPVTATVYNNGNLDANNFLVTLEDNSRIVDYRMISLEDGENKKIEFSWTASSGEHVLSAYIDPLPEPDGVIPEIDEENNKISTPVTVKNPTSTLALTELVAYWPMDDGLGNSVKDYSGNGNHGLVSGASWSEGVSSSALKFDGIDDYVLVDDKGNSFGKTLCNNGCSFSLWIKPDELDRNQRILSRYDTTGLDRFFCMYINAGDYFFWVNGDGDSTNISTSATHGDLASNGWHHLVGTFNGSTTQAGVTQLYVDGKLKDTSTKYITINETAWQDDETVFLGVRDDSSYVDYLNGSIDEIRIYSRALSPTEIEGLFGLHRGGPLVAAYYLDEGFGSVANDSSGNENHGIIHGASWADGFSESALSFDGVDDYVDLGDYWGVEDTEELSLGAWVKPSGDGIYSKMDILSKRKDIEVVYRRALGEFACRLCNESVIYSDWVVSSPGFGLDKWHQVYCVYNTSHIMLYVNGELQDDVKPYSGNSRDGASILTIGRQGSNNAYYFKGLIDEILIYDIAITPEVIRQQYNDYTTALIYHFSEGSGNTTHDSSLNNNTGYIYGANWTEGVSGYALEFDDGDYVQVPDVDSLNIDGDFTVTYWIKTLTNLSGVTIAKRERGYNTGGRGWNQILRSDGRVGGGMGDGSHYVGDHNPLTTSVVNNGVWHHITIVYDRGGGEIRGYVDGEYEKSTSIAEIEGSILNNNVLRIGMRSYNSNDPLNGKIDGVRIYSRALAPEEIKGQFRSYRHGPLVAAYYLDESNGSIANDSSGNENHGIIHGASWADGISESALSFDGINDYVEVADHTTLKPNNELTLSAWVKLGEPLSSQDSWAGVFGKYVSGAEGSGYYLEMRGYNNRTVCVMRDASHTYHQVYAQDEPFDLGWHQITCTYNGSRQVLYIDGIEKASNEWSGNLSHNNQPLKIGGGSGTGYFKGLIDEALIYDVALTPEVIRQQYNDYTTSLIYHFSEGSGNKTQDSSLNNNTGVLHGPNWTEGVSGYGLSFDGIDDYVDSGLVDGICGGKLAISSWVYVDGETAQDYQRIVDKGGNLAFWVGNEGDICVRLSAERNASGSMDCFNTNLEFDRWHQLAFSYDMNAEGRLKLYVDGRLFGHKNNYFGMITPGTATLIVGNTKANNRPFNGLIDEVRIHRRALNESEILDSYHSYQGGPLAALYYMDEGEGDVAVDYSGNGNNGSVHGASWGEGFSESGLFFDGVDDYVQVSDSHTLDFLDAVTVEAWVNPNQSQNQWPMIFHKGVSGERILLRLDQSTLKASFIIWVDGVGKSLTSKTPLPAGRWSHLAASFNKSSGEWKIYVNGELDNSMNSSWSLPNTRGSNAFIGYAGFGDSFFVGGLDEIKLYHTVLAPERLKEKYDLYRDVLIYHFNEGYGRLVSDSSLHEHTGLVKGANWTEGISGYGLSFDGVDDYIAVNDLVYDSPVGGVTVCSWVKSNKSSQVIASWDRSEFWRFGIGSEGDEGTVTWNTMASGIDDMSSLVRVDDGLWHHLCASYDSGTGEKRIYVDGHLDASKTAHDGNPLGQYPRYGFIGVGSEATEFDGDRGPNQYFKGVLDDFRIYGRALSEEEVADLYGLHAYIYGGCSGGGVRLGVSEFCCGVSDGLCVGDFGVFCHDPDCDVIGCPGGGVRLGDSDFCCGVSDGLCVEDFGVECVDPDCVFSGNGSCTLPVNPLSGSGSDSVDSSQDSSPISSPAMPFSPLDFLLMSTMAAALYVALSGNSESIRDSLSDIMSRSRGLDIQNMRVDPVVVDGVDVNYVNLDGVETEEVIIRNVEDLQFIDLSGLKADRVVLEDISVYGDINLRGAQIGELVVRNVDLGGDLIFNCDTSPGSPISSLTVEGVKAGGDVSLELDKVDSQVGNVLVRDVEAKGSIRAYLDIPEGFDAGNLTVENVTAGGDVRASLEGEGDGSLGDLVCRNIKAVGKVTVDVRAKGKTAGEVFLESVTALGNVSLDVNSYYGGDVNDMLVKGIVSAGDLGVDVSSKWGSEVDGLRVEDVQVSRDLSIDLRSDDLSDFRSVEISEGVVGGDFNLEVDVDDEADMSSVDVHNFSVGDTGDFYFKIDDGSRISGIDLSDLVFGKDFDLDVDLDSGSRVDGGVDVDDIGAGGDGDLSLRVYDSSELSANIDGVTVGDELNVELDSDDGGWMDVILNHLSSGNDLVLSVEADDGSFTGGEFKNSFAGGDMNISKNDHDVDDSTTDDQGTVFFEEYNLSCGGGSYIDPNSLPDTVTDPVIVSGDNFMLVNPDGTYTVLPKNENTEMLLGILFPQGFDRLTPKEIFNRLYGDSDSNPWLDVEKDPYAYVEDSSSDPVVYSDDKRYLGVLQPNGEYMWFSYDRIKDQLAEGLQMSVDPTFLSPQTIFGILYQDHPEYNPYVTTSPTGQTTANSNVLLDLLVGVSGFIGGFNSFIANDVLRLDTWAGWASGVTDPLLGEGWSRAVALPLGVVDFITLGLLNGACTLVDTGFDIGEAYHATDVPELVDWVRTIIDPTHPATLGERAIALALAAPIIITRGKVAKYTRENQHILGLLSKEYEYNKESKIAINAISEIKPIIQFVNKNELGKNVVGIYDAEKNIIKLDIRLLETPGELESTIIHEGTHVSQKARILSEDFSNLDVKAKLEYDAYFNEIQFRVDNSFFGEGYVDVARLFYDLEECRARTKEETMEIIKEIISRYY